MSTDVSRVFLRAVRQAFLQNNWPLAIELFEFLGENRTQLQSARLAYARKRVAR